MTGLLYRLLLLLYPPAFRRRYGRQMLEDLREMRQRGDSVGWAFLDVLRTAPREWLDVAGGGSRQGLRSDWPVEHLGEVLRELRRSLRGLTRTPGYTLVVVATLGMGIGGTSAVFSWMEGLVLRPLPAVRNPSELFSIDVWARDGQDDAPVASYRNLLGLREGLATQARVVGFGYARLHVTDQGTATTDPSPDAWGAFVTSNYFSVLGVRPVLGRFFSPAERMTGQSRRSAVISDALWTRRFARDPRIVGRQVQIDGFDFQIIGVAPSDFVGTTIGLRLDVWLPVEAAPPLRGEASLLDDGSTRWLRVFGRFAPGLSLLTLDQHVKALWQRLRADDPPDARVLDATAVPLDVGVAARLKPLLSILLGITGFMLLAICSNVANLTLLRGARRDHEVAVLLALGAGRGRVAARVLSESAILAGLGVCTGVALAALGVHLLPALLPPSTIPIGSRAPMDPRVLLFRPGSGLPLVSPSPSPPRSARHGPSLWTCFE